MSAELEKKAKRRIRRFIETGVHQARVHQIEEKVYEYKVNHRGTSLFFKRDILGRLRKLLQT